MTKEMLDMAIEIEGLIRIVKDGNPSVETYTLLVDKAEELTQWTRLEWKKNCLDTPAGLPAGEQDNTPPESTEPDNIPDSALDLEKEDDLQMEEAEAEEEEAEAEAETEETKAEAEKAGTEVEVETESDSDDILLNLDDEEESAPNENRSPINLRQAFSLNDRFLYSRELFDGDMKMFDSTLKTLERVDDFSVAEDYFYNELDWDRENPTVQAFMERLETRFK